MAESPNQASTGQPQAVMSLETVFINHYLDALRSLQNTWLNTEGHLDGRVFNLQIRYLMAIIPDPVKRNELHTIIDEAIKKSAFNSISVQEDPTVFFTVVSEIIEFLCGSFDLLHSDIIGPAGSKQYNVIEIPDMPAPQAQPEPESQPAQIKESGKSAEIEAEA